MNPSTSDRKQELVRQGAVFRANLRAAVDGLPTGGSSGALLKGAFGSAVSAAMIAFKGGGLSSLKALLPLATAGLSFLSTRHLLKPAIRVAVVAGSIAIGYRLFGKKKRND